MAGMVIAQEHLVNWAAALTATGVIVAALWRPVKTLYTFLKLWNGVTEKRDPSGKVVLVKEELGVPALLQVMQEDLAEVKSQVKNHHDSNLRDDIDQIKDNLDEHIRISKEYDRAQDATAKELHDTAQKLDRHIEETKSYVPMIKRLHDKWTDKTD